MVGRVNLHFEKTISVTQMTGSKFEVFCLPQESPYSMHKDLDLIHAMPRFMSVGPGFMIAVVFLFMEYSVCAFKSRCHPLTLRSHIWSFSFHAFMLSMSNFMLRYRGYICVTQVHMIYVG